MNYEQLIKYLSEWCSYRADFFKYLWPLKGGWEAWVQADFAAYLVQKEGLFTDLESIPIQREYPINNQRIDLFFGATVENGFFAEIKCQSFGNWNMFTNGLTEDINKLTELQKVAAQNNVPISTAVIGIGFEQAALQQMQSQGFELVYFSSEVVCGVFEVKNGNNTFLNNNNNTQTASYCDDPFQTGTTRQGTPYLKPDFMQ